MAEMKKLTRSADKKLAGVCGGIAEYFDVDPTLVRVIYTALTIFLAGFPGLLLYLILMLLMPDAPKANNVEDVEFKKKKKKEDK